MENLYELSLEITRWLQENYPQLEGFFLAISAAGREEFYLAVLPLIYWCINKKLGRMLGYVFFASIVINTTLKHALRNPRPFWIDPEVGIETTEGYGIPSGHTQYVTTLYLLVAAAVGGFWVWLVAGILIILMALSRIYLGAHFFQDVIGGFLVGVVLLAAALFWDQRIAKRFQKRILGQRMMAAVLVVLGLAALYAVVLLIIGEPDLSVPWAAHIPAAEVASIREMARAIGALLGFSVGIVLERSRVRFRADGSIGKRAGRYVAGIIITVIIWQGLGAVFPREPLALSVPLQIFRYFLVTLWAAYFAPWMFVRVGLADTDPDPGINLSLK